MPSNDKLKKEIRELSEYKGLKTEVADDATNSDLQKVLTELKEAEPAEGFPVVPGATPEPEKGLVIAEGCSITRNGKIYGPGEEVQKDWFTADELKTHQSKKRIVKG